MTFFLSKNFKRWVEVERYFSGSRTEESVRELHDMFGISSVIPQKVMRYIKILDPGSAYLLHLHCVCSGLFSLSKKYHVVDVNEEVGLVFPSVYHDGCGFNRKLKLLDWNVQVELLSYVEYCPYCKQNPCLGDCEVEIAKYNADL